MKDKDKDKFKDQGKQGKGKESKSLDRTTKEEIQEQGNPKGKKFKKYKSEKRINDPSWYNPNPQITKDVASLPFAVYNGVTYKLFTNTGATQLPGPQVANTVIPGIAVYKYIPWYGTATPTSALNLTMRALYSFVRHVNSGRTNYEAPDLMLYIMAMDNVYLLIHEIKRILRLTYHYNLENRDVPAKILSAMNIDIQDLVTNIASYRAELNIRIAKANSLAVPSNFNLFKRRAVMGSVVLTDEPNRPTQLIVPQSDGFYIYNPTGTTGGKLDFINISSDNGETVVKDKFISVNYHIKTKIRAYFELLDSMLTVLLSDEDINIMSGDIIKAYGDNLFRLPFLAENEIQEISHDENLLLQFTNSTVLDKKTASFSFDSASADSIVKFETASGRQATPTISQINGSLVARCIIDASLDQIGKDWSTVNSLSLAAIEYLLLDTSEANSISPENIMEWTRLVMMCVPLDDNPNTADTVFILEAGVEIGLGWLVVTPTSYWNLKNLPQRVQELDCILEQFYQFGTVDIPGYARELPKFTTVPGAGELGLIVNIQDDNGGTMSAENSYRNRNSWYCHQTVSGMTFGPKFYANAGTDRNIANNYTLYIDGSISKLYEKTALVARSNIKSLHDVALLGLISSPYITSSK